jgi:SAM-dependent methyltransferase/uncharacterized coiled-coil protein SlyX
VSDEERPWLTRIVAPEKPPTTWEEAGAELEELREIQAHREWVIDGLREHVANLQADLARAKQRVDRLEAHVGYLEDDEKELRAHIENLEVRLSDVEAHAANLERSFRTPSLHLGGAGVLPTSSRPRIEALFRLGEKLWNELPEIQKRFPAERGPDFWYWLLWHGGGYDPDVTRQLSPQPDANLRERVVGEGSERRAYFRSGLVDWRSIDSRLRGHGFDPRRGGRILDFGVGCGRIFQFFALYAESCELVGADVDGEAVAWCREHFDFGSFERLGNRPPTSFPDASFDAIYAFSVFSHLREDLHLLWLEELRRIARPGALLVLTVQGRCVTRALESRATGGFPSGEELEAELPRIEETGFGFFPYRGLRFGSDQQDYVDSLGREEYGSTIIFEPYVRARWSELFEVVAFDEAPDDWQDYVVLRRR